MVQEAARGGIEVPVSDGRIDVVLTDVVPGSAIEVRWTESATARVSAAAGSSFSYGEGEARASVAPGAVRVELPRFAPAVSLQVDGRTYLRRSSGVLDVLVPTTQRTPDFIVFLAPED